MLVHSKEKFFFPSPCYLRGMTFGIWVSSVSQIMSSFSTNKRQLLMCLHISTGKRRLTMCLHPVMNKRQLIMRLHPVMNKWQLIMRLHPVMNKWQLTSLCSLKIHHGLAFFGRFFLGTNHGRRFASPLTHTWQIVSDFLLCPYHVVIIDRGEERDGLSFLYSVYYYSRWGSESRTPFYHNPANVLGCHISLSQYIYGPRGIVSELDCNIILSEFELQSNYYVPFQTNNLGGKVWNESPWCSG